MNTELMQAAFPDQYKDGMTLRDYFAAKAMQAMIGCADITATPAVFAHQAYIVADAMMEERERT
jgi:hypothetical protein